MILTDDCANSHSHYNVVEDQPNVVEEARSRMNSAAREQTPEPSLYVLSRISKDITSAPGADQCDL